jgi:hypothetical protein
MAAIFIHIFEALTFEKQGVRERERERENIMPILEIMLYHFTVKNKYPWARSRTRGA